MRTTRRTDLKEIVRERVEAFRRKFGENGSQKDLADFVKGDAAKQRWDTDDLSEIDELMKQADVTIEVHVNFEDDEPPMGFRA